MYWDRKLLDTVVLMLLYLTVYMMAPSCPWADRTSVATSQKVPGALCWATRAAELIMHMVLSDSMTANLRVECGVSSLASVFVRGS